MRMPARRLVVPALLALAGLALLLGLGVWQIQRKAWKEGVIAALRERVEKPPAGAAELARLDCRGVDRFGLSPCEFLPARLTGRFDHAAERHVTAILPHQPDGLAGPGYVVFTPLRLAGGGVILVNRGFVPDPLKRPETRPDSLPEGEVAVTGILRLPQPRSWFDGENAPARNLYFVRAPAELLDAADVARPGPVAGMSPAGLYLAATVPTSPGRFPLALGASIDLPNRHLDYALTWFGLAATLVAVFLASTVAAARRRRAQS